MVSTKLSALYASYKKLVASFPQIPFPSRDLACQSTSALARKGAVPLASFRKNSLRVFSRSARRELGHCTQLRISAEIDIPEDRFAPVQQRQDNCSRTFGGPMGSNPSQTISEFPRPHVATFPVVCIGMSAGGVAPLQTIFRTLSPDTGMAFIVLHHLRQAHPTLLPLILSHSTSMPVQLVEPGTPIEPNHVYILPSGQEVVVTDGAFALHARKNVRGWSNVVSLFLNSLTQSQHGGVAVILSGMDGDGAESLKAFKQRGGITIAQAPDTASSREMPLAAIRTGAVDYVLEPELMARQLKAIAEHFNVTPQ